jgi:NADH:ubiquinone oxidoreductase subunit K
VLDFVLHLASLFFDLGEFGLFHAKTHVWLVLSSLNSCLIIVNVSVALCLKICTAVV